MIRTRLLKNVLCPLAVAAALGFGAVQVAAAPAVVQKRAYCDEEACSQFCGGFGFCEGGRQCICL